jgi:uncharacterized membrane protein YcgQ (UPF0703/DUF1980 family)
MEATHAHEHEHNTLNLHAWAQTAILLGLGLYFAYTIASGNLTNYINAAFAWLSYLAAALFFALGVISAFRVARHHHAHYHDHSHLSWPALAIRHTAPARR